MFAIQLRQDAGRDQPVGQRVARARGNLRAVGNHPPAAVRRARKVRGVKVQELAARHADVVARPQKIRLPEHQRRGQPARTNEFLLAVAIRQDAIEQRRALDQPGFERPPLPGRDQKRQRVKFPGPLHSARVAINVVGDPLLAHEPLAGVPAAQAFRRAELFQRAHQFRKVRTQRAVRAQQLVVGWTARTIVAQQICGRLVFQGSGCSFGVHYQD